MSAAELDDLHGCDIDSSGRFKYVLIRVTCSLPGGEERSRLIVRGYSWADYHADIYDDVASKLEAQGFDCECLGGGRIEHAKDAKTISVYGYSQGYGRADHAKTADLIRMRHPEYTVTWSNDGY